MAKVNKTSSGLRDILFDEIQELRSGKGNPSKAQAVAKLAQQIMTTVRVEMEYQKLTDHRAKAFGEKPNQIAIGKMDLGSASGAGRNATAR